MIIYGSRAVHVKSAKSRNAICPSCTKQGTLLFSVFRRHAHIFWIPLFPIGKKGVSQCEHCKNVLNINEMPEDVKREYQNFKSDAKGPIWQFSGLVIIASLIVWVNYASGEDDKKELQYIASPLQGDIYEYKIKTGSYSTLKVIKVSEDSVFVSPNQFEISRVTGVYKIDKEENYSNMTYGISRGRIKEMHTTGEIIDINRK